MDSSHRDLYPSWDMERPRISLPTVIFPGSASFLPPEKLVGSLSHLSSFLFTYEVSQFSAPSPIYPLSKTCRFCSKDPVKGLESAGLCSAPGCGARAHIPGGRPSALGDLRARRSSVAELRVGRWASGRFPQENRRRGESMWRGVSAFPSQIPSLPHLPPASKSIHLESNLITEI